MTGSFDVVVVGAGQAGLGVSYFLEAQGLEYTVLERGRIGETWRSQRWDSFALNTPNFMNGLPGDPYSGAEDNGFMSHLELAISFEAYAQSFGIPVRTGVTVTGVRPQDDGPGFIVEGEECGERVSLAASDVVIASGIMQTPKIPALSTKVPDHIAQLHTGNYRSPLDLPTGSVVVVGGGQSGAQIVEDLRNAGRTVYFSVSRVGRVPRNYRGRDFMDWWIDLGFWDVDLDDLDDPTIEFTTNPLTSGVGPLGHTISLQQLAGDGIHLMGRLEDVVDGTLVADDRLEEYARFADQRSQELRDKIDSYIETQGIDAPLGVPDPADEPLGDGETLRGITSLSLADAEVGSIVWSTGFTADFSWIDAPVTMEDGRPLHHKGVAPVPGIYFIGFPWLSKRKSGVVYGIEEDARHIVDTIVARSGRHV